MAASGASSLPGVAARPMVLMGTMMAGAATVDAITANLLPITARHFTGDLTLIAVMVALNRVCGFLVQPYAAWRSDSHRSAGGRRRPFLLAGWPIVFVCVGLLGLLPHLVPPAHQGTAWAVAALFLVNLAMQAALDWCYGSADPIYGDSFPGDTLGRANAVRSTIANLALAVMLSVAVPLADLHELWPYLICMGFVAVSWGVAARGLRERLPAALPPRRAYHPLRPLAELRDPHTRRVALVASAVLVSLALTEMFHALFVTETLGLSKATLGWSAAVGVAVSVLCPYPVGLMVDRLGPRPVLVLGFGAVVLAELAFVFWVRDAGTLCAALILFKVAWFFAHVPIVSLMFRDVPPARHARTFAAVQMTRAAVTSVATLLAGHLAQAADSYRMCYLVAAAVSLAGLVGALGLGPARRQPAGGPREVFRLA